MAWKLRKDKLKAEPSATDELEDGDSGAEEAGAAPTDELNHQPSSIAAGDSGSSDDLSFEPAAAATEDDLQFDHGAVTTADDLTFHDEPVFAPEPQPLGLTEHETGSETVVPMEPLVLDAAAAPDPEPEFAPIETAAPVVAEPVKPARPSRKKQAAAEAAPVEDEPVPPAAEAPSFEPPVAAAAPVASEPEPIFAPPVTTQDREAIAPGLVTTESESGLPKVAPFILDTPAGKQSGTQNTMHSVVLRLGNLSATFFLVKEATTIGRPDAAVQNYPDIEVELDDGVSRKHAEIRKVEDGYALVDLGSTNGTILNGEMLQPNLPTPLMPGDRIRIGERTEILFE